MSAPKSILQDLLVYWKSILLILIPLVLCPLPLCYMHSDDSSAVNCAYTVIVMALYWVFELLPIPVTALMPVFVYPLLGVISVGAAASPYLSASNFLFFGGLMIAIGVEEVNLHKRLALRVLLLVGTDTKWIMLGFMVVTWFLSMWMSNTATTAMMLPIALAVIDEKVRFIRSEKNEPPTSSNEGSINMESDQTVHSKGNIEKGPQMSENVGNDKGAENVAFQPDPADKSAKVRQSDDLKIEVVEELHHEEVEDLGDRSQWPESEKKLAKAILLGLSYAANIGGTGTLTGTLPNVVASAELEKVGYEGVTYATWMGAEIPAAAVFLILTWLWLQLFHLPTRELISCGNKGHSRLEQILRNHYHELGPIKFGEYLVGILYIILVILWIFREPKFITGWGSGFRDDFVGDAVPPMLIAFLLFALPRDLPDFYCFRSRDKSEKAKPRQSLLTWKSMKKFPWDVILILGGGFSMAAGVEQSGLSLIIANALKDNLAGKVSPTLFCFIVTTLVCFFTEVTSNASTANIFIPILVAISSGLGVSPAYFALPVAIACSYAFMLPVATPPNAIVFGAGVMSIKDMAISGFVLNWIGIALTMLNIEYFTPLIIDMGNSTSGQ